MSGGVGSESGDPFELSIATCERNELVVVGEPWRGWGSWEKKYIPTVHGGVHSQYYGMMMG